MIPTVFASAYIIFPRSKQALIAAGHRPGRHPGADRRPDRRRLCHRCLVMALAVLRSTSSPASSSPPRVLVADRFRPARIRPAAVRFDWWGLLAMAGFLGGAGICAGGRAGNTTGCRTTTVAVFAIVCVVSARLSSSARVLRAEDADRRSESLHDRNFAVGALFSFVLGIGLYGLTYIYPLYLARMRGYDALMIGETMFISGLCHVRDGAACRPAVPSSICASCSPPASSASPSAPGG